MQVRVLFFGLLKDIVHSAEENVEVPEEATIEVLFAYFVGRFPELKALAASIAIARNQDFARPGDLLADGDEVAFLPPVSGGSRYSQRIVTEEGHLFAITRDPIESQALGREILQDCDGAICTFEGVVRNQSKGRATRYLEYECYEAMAIRQMAEIGKEVAAKFEISRIAMVHRLGRLEIGEASVIVIAASPHRRASFDAALEGINRLKSTVPIWKKEFYVDGEVWVDGAWDESIARAAAKS